MEGTDTDYVNRLMAGTLDRFDIADLTAFYIVTLERRAAVFGEAIRLLGDSDRLPLLVHCSAGKDRTGLLVALVLTVLGTPRDVVVTDYALTGELRPNRIADYAPLLPAGLDLDAVRVLFETPAEAMRDALAHLDAELRRRGGPVARSRRPAPRTTSSRSGARCLWDPPKHEP